MSFQDFFQTILPAYLIMLASLVGMGYFCNLLFKTFWQQTSGRHRYLPLAIMLLGLLLRLWWVISTQPIPQSDFAIHWNISRYFYEGNLVYSEIERHPGLMILVSFAMRLFSPTLWSAWILNLIASIIFMMLMHEIARPLSGRIAALALLIAVVVFPQFVGYNALVATETISTAYMLMIVWALIYSRQHQAGTWFWVALGMLSAGGILIRSTTVFLLGLAVLVLLFRDGFSRWHGYLKNTVLLSATTGILFSGWCLHQYTITGSPKPFWGMALWLACAANAETKGRVISTSSHPVYAPIYQQAENLTFTSDAKKQVWIQNEIQKKAVVIIKADPETYFKTGFLRMKRILWTAQSGISWSAKDSTIVGEHIPQPVVSFLRQLSTHSWRIILCLSPLAFLGLGKSRQHRDILLLLVAFTLIWLVFHYLFSVASERYGFQIIPFVFLLSSAGISYLLDYLSSLRRPAASGHLL